MNDVTFAIRQLWKSPRFATAAIVTLAVCLGANLTVFAVVDAILVRALPFPEPDRLVVIHNVLPDAGISQGPSSIAHYFERRNRIPAFDSMSMWREQAYTVGESYDARRVICAEVTPEFFETLGIQLARGQVFSEEQLTYGPNLVAILTDSYWRAHCGADPNALGRAIILNSERVNVIGILPPDFQFQFSSAEIYRPLVHHEEVRVSPGRHGEHAHSFDGRMIARLATHASLPEAQAQLDAFNAECLAADPMGTSLREAGFHSVVAPLHADYTRSVKPMLWMVQAGVLCLLSIGCVNLGSLFLIRIGARSKEWTVRLALGASRRRIAATFLVECLVLALVAGALATVFAAGGIRLVRWLGATRLPLGADVQFDSRMILVSLLGSVLVGVGIALPIIWVWLRTLPHSSVLAEPRGTTAHPRAQSLRHAFLVAQIALAFVLLSGAGLLSLSLRHLLEQSPGFAAEQVLSGRITLPWMHYRNPVAKSSLARRLLREIETLPGVKHAALSSALPFTPESAAARTFLAQGSGPSARGEWRAHFFSYVSSDYWNTMGIPLLQGRLLQDADLDSRIGQTIDAPGPAVVDETLARRYWPEGGAIGGRIRIVQSDSRKSQELTVVGVVGRVKQQDLAEAESLGAVYEPYSFSTDLHLLIRTSLPPSSLIPSIRKRIRDLDAAMPIDDFKLLQENIDDSLVSRRSPAMLAGLFAGIALLLAAFGTYGVLSYAVAQRRREVGVRMALGAKPTQIARQFLGTGLKLLGWGALLGCIGTWALSRAIWALLFEVPTFPFALLAGTTLVMMIATLLAAMCPAVRAARVSPLEAMRYE